ncbi:MAG TPA: APC family permease [Ignavibacteriaceae bacterium]|nr:APC family permease [Ignavibacteriaceae bacterium]
MAKHSIISKIKKVIIGAERNIKDPNVFHKLALTAFLAWVGLGADGLSSTSYGPEEAYLALGNHHYLSIFVALASGLTVLIISMSYSHIIELFPLGGGGYLVASKLLSAKTGMVSGCALLIDYVLTISISVASGTDALFSFLPNAWVSYKLFFAIFGVTLLIILNMRGIRESVIPLLPIFIIFIITHVFIIIFGISTHLFDFATFTSKTSIELSNTQSELGLWGMIFLIIKAYTMGAGTYTGIEAVSNGMPMLREPKVVTAKKTMRFMLVSLSFMVIGIMFSYILFDVQHTPGKTLNAVLFENVVSGWSPGFASIFLIVILVSEAVILFVAAQTGFLGGPSVLANMAADRWFPSRFAILSDRLITQNGVLLMGGSALIILILTKGSVRLLVVLYSINVFLTFFLSQLGMVTHWWKCKKEERKWFRKITVNSIGLVMTTVILISVVVFKFFEGGWITIILTGSLITFSVTVKRHYKNAGTMLSELDSQILPALTSSIDILRNGDPAIDDGIKYDKEAKTAVVLVNGFNGLGVHTLLSVVKTFPGVFKNFIFLQVGVLDAGNFKGTTEIHKLEEHIKQEGNRYVQFIRQSGYYAENFYKLETEAVEGIESLAAEIFLKFPNSVFFGGQLVFPRETFFSRLLHNQIVFTTQRRLYHQGLPFVILPIRIGAL